MLFTLFCIVLATAMLSAIVLGIRNDIRTARNRNLRRVGQVIDGSGHTSQEDLPKSDTLKLYFVEIYDSLNKKGEGEWKVVLRHPKWKQEYELDTRKTKLEAIQQADIHKKKLEDMVQAQWLKEMSEAHKPTQRIKV